MKRDPILDFAEPSLLRVLTAALVLLVVLLTTNSLTPTLRSPPSVKPFLSLGFWETAQNEKQLFNHSREALVYASEHEDVQTFQLLVAELERFSPAILERLKRDFSETRPADFARLTTSASGAAKSH